MLKLTLLSLAFLFATPTLAEDKLSDSDALKIVQELDERQQNGGDFRGLCYIKETERGKVPKVIQAVYYRRDKDNKILILFTKPKEEAGKGYLKIDKNLWMYDSATGKWERRTERERIGGTNSRRSDFDESRLADEYVTKALGNDKLGQYTTNKLELTVKDGIDAAFPKLVLQVDKGTNNLLKKEEYALSGKLLRTTYYPQWVKEHSKSKKAEVWVPKEMRIFDELEKGNSTVILMSEMDFSDLKDSIFTKAWVEGKSR